MADDLKARVNWEIRGEASTGSRGILKTTWMKPDVVLLDITMPALSGGRPFRKFSKLNPVFKILVFTMHDSGQVTS